MVVLHEAAVSTGRKPDTGGGGGGGRGPEGGEGGRGRGGVIRWGKLCRPKHQRQQPHGRSTRCSQRVVLSGTHLYDTYIYRVRSLGVGYDFLNAAFSFLWRFLVFIFSYFHGRNVNVFLTMINSRCMMVIIYR